VKPAFKDEQEIVDLAADVENAQVCFYPAESDLSHRFLAALRSGGFEQRERPDFEDRAASLLLEAMRVDDHPRPGKKDKTRMREAEALQDIQDAGFDVHPDAKVFAAVSSGLPMERDHGYRAYVEQFTRTVVGHGRKSDAYRAERPGFELGFIFLDESTAYFETLGAFGPDGAGRPHFWFADAAFANVMVPSGADCIVWLTPYKRLLTSQAGAFSLPEMTIVDVGLLRQEEHFVYDARRMVSAEE